MSQITINPLVSKIEQLPTQKVNAIIADIARATKKKRLSSKSMTYIQFCNVIAESLTKPSTQFLIRKYDLN